MALRLIVRFCCVLHKKTVISPRGRGGTERSEIIWARACPAHVRPRVHLKVLDPG